MGLPNLENDEFFLRLVESGFLKVTKDGKVFNTKTGRRIGGRPGANGYCAIGMRDESGKVWHILVHRLVFILFERKLVGIEIINRDNGRKSENDISNLEATTYSGNNQHAIDTGLVDTSKISITLMGRNMGYRHSCAKFTNDDVMEIRELSKKGYTERMLAHKYCVGKTTIHSIISNQSYQF